MRFPSARFLVLLAAVLLCPLGAGATVVQVYCSGSTPPNPLPADSYLTMTDALNALSSAPNGPHTINVRGTCHNEGLQIIGFSRLTIQTPPGETTVISHDQTAACGTPSATPIENQPVLRILDSHQINFRMSVGGSPMIIRGGTGVNIEDSSVGFNGVTVENSRAGAIGLNNASSLNLGGRLGGVPSPNLIQNTCGNGIGVGNGSSLNLNSSNTIQNNQGAGILVNGFVNLGASSDSSGQIVIQDNQGPGLNLVNATSIAAMGGQVIIQNNSLSTNPSPFRGGIVITSGFLGIGSGGVQIIGNSGPGIWADMQGKVRLGPPINASPSDFTITGNTEEGVRILHMSVVWSNGGTTFGNGVADVTCDSTSLLFGNVTGFAVNKCANTEQNKKK